MSEEETEVVTTRGLTELTVHRRGGRVALALPVAPATDIDLDRVDLIGRLTLAHEQPGKMNYLAVDRETGALLRGYLTNSRTPEAPAADEVFRNAWLTVRALPEITEIFIGTDKDL